MKKAYAKVARRPVGARETAEYDAFGPWTQEISRAEEMPPCFDPYWEALRGADILAKLPFPVERRDAVPGSDLYERLVAVGPEGIRILSLEGQATRDLAISYDSVSWVSLIVELLDARIAICGARGAITNIGFNAVSEELAQRILKTARGYLSRRATLRPSTASRDIAAPPDDRQDFRFSRLLWAERARNPKAALVAFQPTQRMSAGGDGTGLRWLRNMLRPTYLEPAMILELEDEVLVLKAGRGPRSGKKGFRLESTWIPFGALKGVRTEAHSLPCGALTHRIFLDTGSGFLPLLFAAPQEASVARLREFCLGEGLLAQSAARAQG
jgi:hypothetical protein